MLGCCLHTGSGGTGNLRARFEQTAQKEEEESRKKLEEGRERRKVQEARENKESQKREEVCVGDDPNL